MNNSKQDKSGGTSAKKIKPVKRAEKERHATSKRSYSRGRWLGIEAQKWYILLSLSVLISILLFPSILSPPRIYRLGDIADRDIKASREFLVENTEMTEKKREEAIKTVSPVYDFDPTSANLVSRIKEAFNTGRTYLVEIESRNKALNYSLKEKAGEGDYDIDSIKGRFFEILDLQPDENIFTPLFKSGFSADAENGIVKIVGEVIGNGVVSNKVMLMSHSGKEIILHNINSQDEVIINNLDRFFDLSTASAFIERHRNSLKNSLKSPNTVSPLINLAIALLDPNVTFNKRETELRKEIARQAVSPFYFKVLKGEMLIREGERITQEHLLKLSEQNKFLRDTERLGKAPAMSVLIGFLFATMYLVGFIKGRPTSQGIKDILFIAITLFTVFLLVLISKLVSEEISRGFNYFSSRALIFAIPVASGAMLISVFISRSASASFSLIASVLACLVVGGQAEFFLYFFIGSLVAATGVENCRERGDFIKTGLKVGLVNMALALSIEALHGYFYTIEAIIAIISAFSGGILVGVIGTGLLPLVEMSFGYASDIKLLELASLDQPLLQELMVQSQGTYHHSVIVSNMVEATAKSINANPLLARVAAYYHDIGKVNKPLYFVENQMGRENKHEKLAPSMSSLILISHVKDGVELARKSKLGQEIIDIISQHHGTSLITFFYEKAKEQAEKKEGKSLKIKEEDYRYPGPKPQTKEAGLVMLADAVEAASKTLVNPTSARIQGMVQKIINKVFSDGQLDECELTLKDLHNIAKSFNKTLSGIFHHRIEYPESAAKESGPKGKKVEDGSTDQLSAGDTMAKKTKGQEEPAESLKRLGI